MTSIPLLTGAVGYVEAMTGLELLAWIALLMFLNAAIMAPPSEHICLTGGAVAAVIGVHFSIVLLVATISNLLGTTLWYVAGRYGAYSWVQGHSALRIPVINLYIRPLPYIRKLFERRGILAVAFGRGIPLLRSIISLPAGDIPIQVTPFLASSFCGILIWCAIWTSVGWFVGQLGAWWVLLAGLTIATLSCVGFYVIDQFLSRRNGDD